MNSRRKLVKKIYDSFDKVMKTEKHEDIGEWLNTTLPAIVDEAIEVGKVEGRIEGQLRERDRAARAADLN